MELDKNTWPLVVHKVGASYPLEAGLLETNKNRFPLSGGYEISTSLQPMKATDILGFEVTLVSWPAVALFSINKLLHLPISSEMHHFSRLNQPPALLAKAEIDSSQ